MKNKAKFLPHVHLNNLIKNRFDVVLAVEHHIPTNGLGGNTVVAAYPDVRSAHDSNASPIAIVRANCSINDRYNKRTGLTLALRRMYRELKELV